jgi:hypothetical protein
MPGGCILVTESHTALDALAGGVSLHDQLKRVIVNVTSRIDYYYHIVLLLLLMMMLPPMPTTHASTHKIKHTICVLIIFTSRAGCVTTAGVMSPSWDT